MNEPRPVAKTVDPNALQRAIDAAEAQNMNMSTPFGPGEPIRPWDSYRGIPRTWDFMPGYNLKTRADRDGRLSFAALKALCDVYDVANLCIEHRIDDVRSLKWIIRAADWATGDTDAVIRQAYQIMRKPEGPKTKRGFRAWLAMFLRDTLRYDAGCLYKQRNMLGEVIGLKVVDGTTIGLLQDGHGNRPTEGAPAFTQIIQGTVWEWLTDDDLIYEPFRPSSDTPYGFTAIESALMTANTDVRFQQHWLSWFTEGDIPEGFATAPPDVTTPEQLERWEEFWHAMNAGDDAIKHRLKFIPNGTKLDFPKEKDFDTAFPLFLMRKMCAAFHVTPNDIGFTDDVNRATGDTQVDVQFRVGTLPLVQHVEDILTAYLQDDRGLPVVFEFDKGQEKEDRVATAQADKIYVEMGAVSVSEIRERVYGLVDDSERPVPRFIFSARQGPIPLVSLFNIAGVIDPMTALPSKDQPLENAPYAGTPGVLPEKAPGAPAYQRADFNPDEPEFPEQEKPVPGSGVVQPSAPPAPPGPVQARKSLSPFALSEEARRDLVKWRGSSVRRVAKGQRPRMFESDHIPDFIADTIWLRLEKARSRADVDAVFTAVRKATDFNPYALADNTGADAGYEEQEDISEYTETGELMPYSDASTDASLEEATLEQQEQAGLNNPKGEGWQGLPAKTTPQMHMDLDQVDHWRDKIKGAFSDLYSAEALGEAAEEVYHSIEHLEDEAEAEKLGERILSGAKPAVRQYLADHEDMIKTYAQLQLSARRDIQALDKAKQVYTDMRSDAFIAGQVAAMVQIRGTDEDKKRFRDWTPGHPSSIDEASRWTIDRMDNWDGVDRTTMVRLANVLYDGLSNGKSIDEMTADMQGYLGDADRAEMIVHTESARMLTAASMEAYTAAGLSQFDWLISAGACEQCEEQAASNPHSILRDDQPPAHPRCRCSVAPVEVQLPTKPSEEPEVVLSNGAARHILKTTVADGGSSVSPLSGQSPTAGYMVARQGLGSVMPEDKFYSNGRTALQRYVAGNQDEFRRPDSYLGTWVDNGTVYIDTSRNVMDLEEAKRMAVENDQIAIWDVANGVEINTGGTGGADATNDITKAYRKLDGASATVNFYRYREWAKAHPEEAAAEREAREAKAAKAGA